MKCSEGPYCKCRWLFSDPSGAVEQLPYQSLMKLSCARSSTLWRRPVLWFWTMHWAITREQSWKPIFKVLHCAYIFARTWFIWLRHWHDPGNFSDPASKSSTQRMICNCFSGMGSLSFVSFVLLSNIVGDLGGGSGNSSMTNTAASLLHRLLITLIPQMFPSPPTCINNISLLFHN